MTESKSITQEELDAMVNHLFANRFNHTLHAYIDITNDLVAGTLLSQIMYWFSESKDGKPKVSIQKDGYYWIAKRREDWMDEIRISQKQYDTAISKIAIKEPLKDGKTEEERQKERDEQPEKFLVVRTYHYNGVPMTHIRPIAKNINNAIRNWKSHKAREIIGNIQRCNGSYQNGNIEDRTDDFSFYVDKSGSSILTNGEYGNAQNVNMEIPKSGKSYNIYNNINNSTENTTKTTTNITNKDYYTENTRTEEEKEKVGTSVPTQKKVRQAAPYIVLPDAEESKPHPTDDKFHRGRVERMIDACEVRARNELNYDSGSANVLRDCLNYFCKAYEKRTGYIHGYIGGDNLLTIIRFMVDEFQKGEKDFYSNAKDQIEQFFDGYGSDKDKCQISDFVNLRIKEEQPCQN